MTHHAFTICGKNDSPIRGDVRFSETTTRGKPVIIFCHGFKGFKDWGGWPYMAEQLAGKGFGCITFNFSHNGVGENLFEFTELEKFKESTFSQEEEDLHCVISALKEGTLPGSSVLNAKSIGLIGHSRGGFSALCIGASEPSVRAVATLAAVSQMSLPGQEDEKAWRERGVRYVLNTRTGQQLPLGVALLDDMLRRQNSIEEAAKALSVPLLIIHGDKDEAVPVSCAEDLKRWARNAELHILSGASHTFGIKHPFAGTTPEFDQVIDLLSKFFQNTLS